MMLKLGFDPSSVDLIMECVSAISYKIRFNDTETEEFMPTRGLRQGVSVIPLPFPVML